MSLRSVRRVRASLLLLVFAANLENPTTAVSDVLSADTLKHSLMTTVFYGAMSGRSRTAGLAARWIRHHWKGCRAEKWPQFWSASPNQASRLIMAAAIFDLY
jgi:hypothetical protein